MPFSVWQRDLHSLQWGEEQTSSIGRQWVPYTWKAQVVKSEYQVFWTWPWTYGNWAAAWKFCVRSAVLSTSIHSLWALPHGRSMFHDPSSVSQSSSASDLLSLTKAEGAEVFTKKGQCLLFSWAFILSRAIEERIIILIDHSQNRP